MTNTSSVEGSIFNVILSFKRDRKIANKTELLKIQNKVDDCFANVEALQNKKKNAGFVQSLTIGIIGTLVLGGGMSLTMLGNTLPALIGGIVLGVVGIGVCALAYPIFKKINKKMNSKIVPILDGEYDKLTDLCEEGAKIVK